MQINCDITDVASVTVQTDLSSHTANEVTLSDGEGKRVTQPAGEDALIAVRVKSPFSCSIASTEKCTEYYSSANYLAVIM